MPVIMFALYRTTSILVVIYFKYVSSQFQPMNRICWWVRNLGPVSIAYTHSTQGWRQWNAKLFFLLGFSFRSFWPDFFSLFVFLSFYIFLLVFLVLFSFTHQIILSFAHRLTFPLVHSLSHWLIHPPTRLFAHLLEPSPPVLTLIFLQRYKVFF